MNNFSLITTFFDYVIKPLSWVAPKVLNIENLTIDCEINSLFFHHLWENKIIMQILSVLSSS